MITKTIQNGRLINFVIHLKECHDTEMSFLGFIKTAPFTIKQRVQIK